MCGQAGLILGRKRRSEAEVAILKTVFSGLLMHSENRGRHASGLAVIDRDGDLQAPGSRDAACRPAWFYITFFITGTGSKTDGILRRA